MQTLALGFVGVGNMGLPMTARLLQRGYRVTVHDRDERRVKLALAAGAEPARSPAEVARASDIVLVCVMYTGEVEDVVFGANGIASARGRATLVVDHSTIEVERARAMADRLRRDANVGWVDAPVSGGPPSAAEGTLAMFVGGEARDVERASPVLAALSRQYTHMGPLGCGLLTKMINQMFVGACFTTMAEAATFAQRAGLDAARIPHALAGGYADSLLLQRVWPKILAREFTPAAGYVFQMLKDLDLVAGVARGLAVTTPMTSQAAMLYRLLVQRGGGELDNSALTTLYE